MKKFVLMMFVALFSMSANLFAGIPITKVDKIRPTDEVFMDMAVAAAKKSVANRQQPGGAVIILNGAWKATGMPSADKTPEVDAFEKARRGDLVNASVYTINEPTTETINFLNSLGVQAIYFCNDRDAVVAAGVYPSSAYDDAKLNQSDEMAPMTLIVYPDAQALLKK